MPLHPRARGNRTSDRSFDRALSSIPPRNFYHREARYAPPQERDNVLDLTKKLATPEDDGCPPMIQDDSPVALLIDSNMRFESPSAIRSKSPAAANRTDKSKTKPLISNEPSASSVANEQEALENSLHDVTSKKRHVRSHTVPANLRRRRRRASENEATVSAKERYRTPALRGLESRPGFDEKNLADLEKVFKSVLDSYNVTPRSSADRRGHDPRRIPGQPLREHPTQGDCATRRRRNRKPVAEQELLRPRLPCVIPPERPLPESEIVRIGKIVNPYERHRAAPYAFSYWGRVYKKWAYLVHKRGEDGELVWDLAVVSRVYH